MSTSAVAPALDSNGTSRERRAALALVLVALVLRIAVLWIARDVEPWNDQVTYMQRAADLLDGRGYTGSYQSWVKHPGERRLENLPRYQGAYQAPGYPAFLALVMGAFGRKELPIRCVQVVLGALTTWFVYRLGRSAYSHRVGLAAGWFYALDPTFIAFTHYLFNETLFVFLFTLGLYGLWSARERMPLGTAVGVGVALALAAFVKSSVLYLLPLLAIWFVWWRKAERARALRFVAVAALAWSACVAPWTIRNIQVHGGLVMIDSSGPFNLWRGNQINAYARRRMSSDWKVRYPEPFYAYPSSPVAEVGGSNLVEVVQDILHVEQPTDLQMMEGSTKAAIDFALEDPLWTLQRAWYKVVDTWNPTSFVMRHLFKGGYGEIPEWLEIAISWLCGLSYLAALAFACPAMWWRRHDEFTSLALLLTAYYTTIHAITFGLTRFRMPVMPFLMVLAGVGVVAWIDRRRARRLRAA